jgi:hypothetical protein
MKTYKELWNESQSGTWAIGSKCPKCDGRSYPGGYCMDCGTWLPPSKTDVPKRCGIIEKLFEPERADFL